jgi:hypothetical protein
VLSAGVPIRAGREVGTLVQDVITLGGVIDSVAARVGDKSADAAAGQPDALFERRKVGQLIAGALGRGKVECLVHRGQEVPNRRGIWQSLGGPGGLTLTDHIPTPGAAWQALHEVVPQIASTIVEMVDALSQILPAELDMQPGA